jgi:hypothetical protein
MAALVQTAASVVPSTGAEYADVIAGGTITAGMPVYLDAADSNKAKAARANAIGTTAVAGIAMNGASNNQPLRVQRSGRINLGATLVVGESYFLSDAVAGQIIPAGDLGVGDFAVHLGQAETASILVLNIFTAGVAKA